MATQPQIDANRINPQKSTGPPTPEGKARSHRNGLRHGLTAKTCMLADEDPDGLLDLVEEIREKFNPQDTDEDFRIECMAKARLKYDRVMPNRICFAMGLGPDNKFSGRIDVDETLIGGKARNM